MVGILFSYKPPVAHPFCVWRNLANRSQLSQSCKTVCKKKRGFGRKSALVGEITLISASKTPTRALFKPFCLQNHRREAFSSQNLEFRCKCCSEMSSVQRGGGCPVGWRAQQGGAYGSEASSVQRGGGCQVKWRAQRWGSARSGVALTEAKYGTPLKRRVRHTIQNAET